MNVQAGRKDRDRDNLSNQGRRPAVSTGGRNVFLFSLVFAVFLRVVCGASVSRGVCFRVGCDMVLF